MSHLYLDESLDLLELAPGAIVELSGDEARHAVTVSRVRPGERVSIGDGRGVLVRGTVTETGPKRLAIEADEVLVEERPSPIETRSPGRTRETVTACRASSPESSTMAPGASSSRSSDSSR